MGRGKLALEFITKDKSRKTTFEKRKKGLMKKAEEFSILCGVDTCMIVYNGDDLSKDPTIWPQDPEKVKYVIHRYLGEGEERRNRRATTLPDFFLSRRKKLETELSRVRAANLAAKYHVPDEFLDSFSHDQLQVLMSMLGMKLDSVKNRILAAKESAALNIPGMVPEDFRFGFPIHSHVNDYLPIDVMPPLDLFQPLGFGPYFPPVMDPNLMMSGPGPLMLPYNGETLSSSATTNSNGILGNPPNNIDYHLSYSLPVPAYNKRTFYQSPPLVAHQNGYNAMDHQNHNIQESIPLLPDNTMSDNPDQGMLGSSSNSFKMMMMLPPPQQQKLMLSDSMTMQQQGGTTSSTMQPVQLFHDNGNGYNQFFPSK